MYLNVSKAATALAALSSAVTHWSAGSTTDATLTKRTEVAPGIELRILPLGDSITDGFQSSDGNGYRIGLHDNLAGSKLLFVGDRTAGNMANNENAGYSGFTISEIASAASHAISSAGSNIILLHAGTNDMHANSPAASESYDTAPDRLGSLIDQCIQGNPDAVVIVAQIVNSGDSATEARIQTFNNAIPGVVAQRANAGHHVVVVDMRSVTTAYLKDDLHPNDAGYKMMADLWFASIQAVGAKGWIKPPLGLDPIGGSTAACSSGQKQRCLGNPVWYNPSASGIIASGVGHGGDGKFSVNWQPLGRVGSGIGLNGTNVRFADLNGDGRADYLWLNETNGAVIAYLNKGSGNKMSWAPLNDAKEIASGGGPGAGVRFADISGSGKADYLFVEDSGAVHLYANGGPDSKGGWLWLGPRQIASGVPNAKQDNVFFPDLNGDGRADYVVVGQKGEVTLWLNIGSSLSYDITWVPLGEVASGLNTPNVSLVDISGDGRADYMIWDQLGGLTGYLNARGPKEVPVWLDQGADKSIGTGVGVDWTLCHLADFNADGKADYAVVDIKTGGFDLYLNNGKADTSVTGDGVYLIDMDNDGLDDYHPLRVKFALPRCPTRLPESDVAKYNVAKTGPARFQYVKWSSILDDTAFHDALAKDTVVLKDGKEAFVEELQQIAKKRQVEQPRLDQFFVPVQKPLAPSASTEPNNPDKNLNRTYKDAAMEGLETLATLVVARDIKLSITPSPLGLVEDPWKLVLIFASIPKVILIALIEDTLPKDRCYDDVVKDEMRKLLRLSEARPGIYVVWVVDRDSLSPSPNVLWKAIGLVKLYCTDKQLSVEEAKIIHLMDFSVDRKQKPWTRQDLHMTFHRYWLNIGKVDIPQSRKIEDRIQCIMTFCMHLDEKLKAICDTDPSAADNPIDFYLSYAGYSQNCAQRTRNHEIGLSKAYILGLLMGALRVIDGDNYRLDSSVVMLAWQQGQGSLAEAAIARLTNSYYFEGTGFNVYPAGWVKPDLDYTEEEWTRWSDHAYDECLEVQGWGDWSPYSS